MKKRHVLAAVLGVLVMAGCEGGGGDDGAATGNIGDNDPNTVVALGDSITAGHGLSSSEAYPAQLAAITGKRVINAGKPGEESDGGAARASGVLKRYSPAYLLILYGANDVINTYSSEQTLGNLRSIIQAAKANMTIPILATMTPTYASHSYMTGAILERNVEIRQLASSEGIVLVDLQGAFGLDESLLQSDGLHVTVAGAGVMASAFSGRIR